MRGFRKCFALIFWLDKTVEKCLNSIIKLQPRKYFPTVKLQWDWVSFVQMWAFLAQYQKETLISRGKCIHFCEGNKHHEEKTHNRTKNRKLKVELNHFSLRNSREFWCRSKHSLKDCYFFFVFLIYKDKKIDHSWSRREPARCFSKSIHIPWGLNKVLLNFIMNYYITWSLKT